MPVENITATFDYTPYGTYAPNGTEHARSEPQWAGVYGACE